MADIEQQARELREAARSFYKTVAIKAVVCDLPGSVIGWDAVTAAGERLRLALLNQDDIAIATDGLQPIPPAALRAHEVQPEAVDARLDLSEPGERLLAADALEHANGVRHSHDTPVTPTSLATVKPPRDRRTRLREDV